MLRILAISSQVSCGHVGLTAILPAIQALGHEVIALPTVILSNHPGHRHTAGGRMAPAMLEDMVSALERNGWLAGIDRVVTGYLPSAEHVNFAYETIVRIKSSSPDAEIICDPIIGDEQDGVYLDLKAAEAIRDQLLPLSHIILPSSFELSWLTGADIKSETDILNARKALPDIAILATSVPTDEQGTMANVFSPCSATGNRSAAATSCRFEVHPDVPKGTGDFFSGLIASGIDFDLATAQTSTLARLSVNKPHLDIARQRINWISVEPFPLIPIEFHNV